MTQEKLLQHIIEHQCISPVFQPICSLEDGTVFAFEALSRITLPHCTLNIEKLCRLQALKSIKSKKINSLIFLNVDVNIFHDSRFRAGFTTATLREYNIEPNKVIIEITERSAIADMKAFLVSVQH